jgi:hypothetical protein
MGKSKARLARRGAVVVLGVALATGLGATAIGAQRGDDNPETVCHKPGTPAQQELTFDNDALFQAHLAHGDIQGPCTVATPTTPTTVTTPSTPTESILEPGAAPAAEAVTATPRTAG